MRPVILLTVLSIAAAFTPNRLGRFAADWARGLQNDLPRKGTGSSHADMTRAGVEWAWKKFFPEITEPTTNMLNALTELEDWTARVDDHRYGEKNTAEAHFDGERFVEGQARIEKLRHDCIAALRAFRGSEARQYLGRLLHTLQDFYAHSNWVEQGNEDISPDIGDINDVAYGRNASRPTCRDCVWVFNSLEAKAQYEANNRCLKECNKGDVTDWEYTKSGICLVTAWNLRKLRPDATITGPGSSGCIPPECRGNIYESLSSRGDITSGYYGGSHDLDSTAPIPLPADKCTHGGAFDTFAKGIEGINKDSMNPLFSPHYYHHEAAARLATKHTIDFISKLQEPELTKAQLKLLYGVNAPAMIFVIDTTSSMMPVIASVRGAVHDIVIDSKGTVKEPASYMLVPFNDPPDDTPPFQTIDSTEFLTKITALDVEGGGYDCEEPGLHGLYKALEAADEGASIFFFTDAGPKDAPNYVPQTIELAQKKRISIFPFIFPAHCLPDPMYRLGIYEYIAAKSGAISLRADSTDASSLVKAVAGIYLDPYGTPVWWTVAGVLADGTMMRRDTSAPTMTHQINIEGGMTAVTFSYSGAGTMTVTDPDGNAVSGVNATSFESTKISLTSLSTPKPGTWTVRLADVQDGDTLQVFGGGSLHVSRFEFSEVRGQEHAGLFPIERSVVPGESLGVVAQIDRVNVSSATFELRSLDGAIVLQTVDMDRGSGEEFDMPGNIWIGNVTIPIGEFVVHVSGTTPSGEKWHRVIPNVYGTRLNGSMPGNITTMSSSSVIPSPTGRWLNSSSSSTKSTLTECVGCGSAETTTMTGYVTTCPPVGVPATTSVLLPPTEVKSHGSQTTTSGISEDTISSFIVQNSSLPTTTRTQTAMTSSVVAAAAASVKLSAWMLILVATLTSAVL